MPIYIWEPHFLKGKSCICRFIVRNLHPQTRTKLVCLGGFQSGQMGQTVNLLLRLRRFESFTSHFFSWRDGRVVDCTCLENRRTAMYPGFESLSLRFTNRAIPRSKQTSPTNSIICGTFFYPLVSALQYTFSPIKDKVRNLTRIPEKQKRKGGADCPKLAKSSRYLACLHSTHF